ncbi:Inactive leucine-rich repeat receptor-like protein kinase CORYNE, partial [Cucurbita argyrosperma subsp. argyrosperma]
MGFFALVIHILLLLFVFGFPRFFAQSDALVGSSENFVPFSKTSHFKNGFHGILLSVALGVVTGLAGVLFSIWFIRSLVGSAAERNPLAGFEFELKWEMPQGCSGQWAYSSGEEARTHSMRLGGGTAANAAADGGARGFEASEYDELKGLRRRNGQLLFGSLEDAMRKVRENQLELKWEVRLRIAFLHFECNPRILHFNLKPANVLLDAEFEPKLADCGLTNLFPDFDRPASLYTAPECLYSSGYTDKSDIFSFGVILSVLLTGRDPTERPLSNREDGSGSGGSLGRWLEESVEPREAVDKSMRGEGVEEEEEMVLALRIAGVRASELPEDRPCSDDLNPTLKKHPSIQLRSRLSHSSPLSLASPSSCSLFPPTTKSKAFSMPTRSLRRHPTSQTQRQRPTLQIKASAVGQDPSPVDYNMSDSIPLFVCCSSVSVSTELFQLRLVTLLEGKLVIKAKTRARRGGGGGPVLIESIDSMTVPRQSFQRRLVMIWGGEFCDPEYQKG